MKHLLYLAAAVVLASAKPELYKETEDFQYSRSSSDDGSKSGYYGAQRGNMGGNYERAHNMDSLAQNQMSGLVRQVEGELGEGGSNTRTGSVYSAANSRGIYGSGRYDLRNLEGRNFQEGGSYGNSQSRTSSHNSAYSGHSASSSQSSEYSSRAQNSQHQSKTSGQMLHSDNLQSADTGLYDYGRQAAGYNSGYRSQSGHQSSYTNQQGSQGYDSNARTRLIAGAPARVVIRPGGTVYVPIAAQTYDTSHRSSSHDENAINSEAEVLSNSDQQTQYRPTNDAKHYESSYSYQKQWEKHDTQPVATPLAIPTVNSYPQNSELYEDGQSRVSNSQHENSQHAYNSNVKSALSSQSRYRSGYNSQHSSSMANSNAQSTSNSNAYTHGNVADASAVTGDLSSRPKSYQSSYSYHKSWERQGDPYVIIPESNSNNDGQTSQRLTADSSRQGYASQQYGSRYSQAHHSRSGCLVCDENGHLRVARSYNAAQNQHVNTDQQSETFNSQDDLGQQVQNGWENLEDLGQQTQDLKDFSQQTQNNWERQSGYENLDDLGQQTQNNWENQRGFENLGQQTQNNLDDLKDLGQQTQNVWDKLEDFNQQSQTGLNDQTRDEQNVEKPGTPENFGQQSQSPWDKLEDLGQEAQSPWHSQHDEEQNNKHTAQETRDNEQEISQLENFYQQSQYAGENKYYNNDLNNIWNKLNDYSSQNTNKDDHNTKPDESAFNGNFEQQSNWHQISQDENDNIHQQTQILNSNEKVDDSQIILKKKQFENNTQQHAEDNNDRPAIWSFIHSDSQLQTNTSEDKNMNNDNQVSTANENLGPTSQANSRDSSLQSLWDKISNLEQTYSLPNVKTERNETMDSKYSEDHWSQTYNSENSFGSEQSYHQESSNYDRYYPSQSTLLENGSANIPTTKTTVKPTEEDKLLPQDIGRGDIGPEDSSIPDFSATEKPHNPYYTPLSILDTNNNDHKTTSEIEALSLTTQINKTKNLNSNDQNSQQADDNLNVLNQQQWLDNHTQQNDIQFSNRIITSAITSSTTPKSDYHNTNFENVNKQKEAKQFENHNEINRSYSNNQVNNTQKETNIEEGPKEIDQQNMEQQFEDIGQFEQQSQNFDQQSQHQWGQELSDLGQQTQNTWEPQNEFQQESDTQVFENFEQSNQGQYDTQKFYNHRYVDNENPQNSQKLEKSLSIPEVHQETENIQNGPQKNEDIESPAESTEKLGFWKSVGNKFTSAKDSVYSWFKRS